MNELNIELYLLCFNESRMIRHTLNYYSQFCSKITIFDNDSTDDSVKIAKSFDHPIEIKRLDTGKEHREDILRHTRNNCWKESTSDYVIVCDMDEFLYHENLIDQLIKAKNKKVALPVVLGYNMISDTFPNNYQGLITDQVKLGIRSKRFDKQIIFDPAQVKEINFRPGSHLCFPEFYTKSTVIDELIELKLLHYKYLDRDYLYDRHQMYAKRMSQTNIDNQWGIEYLDGRDHIDYHYNKPQHFIQVIDQ